MLKSWCMKYRYVILFCTFLVAFYGYNINRIYGFTLFPDEFGYWSYAAALSGYDWSDITAMGSYYSYGYSLILFPIFQLFSNGVVAYRVAVTVNFLLIGVDYFLLIYVVKKIIPEETINYISVIAGIAIFYPTNLFYAKTTMVETVVTSAFLLICALLIKYLERNKLSTLLFLILAVVYIHFLHMRTVGVAIAITGTILLYTTRNSKKAKHIMVVILVGMCMLTLGFFVKKWAQGILYSTTDINEINVNDYAGQFGKIKYLLSKEGCKDFACGLLGKILYLGLASFGLFYIGTYHCIKSCMGKIKGKEKYETKEWFYIFALLVAMGEILINTIYNIHPIRVDSVVYGRYDEFVVPVFMIFGMIEISERKKMWKDMTLIFFLNAICNYIAIYQITRYNLTNIHGYIMLGMSYLDKLKPYQTKEYFWGIFLFDSIIMILVCIMIKYSKRNNRTYLLYGIIAIEFLLYMRTSSLYIEDANFVAYRHSMLCEKIENLVDEDTSKQVMYINEDEYAFVSGMQFLLRDVDIKVKEGKTQNWIEELNPNDIILLYYISEYEDVLTEKYHKHLANGLFQMYYN